MEWFTIVDSLESRKLINVLIDKISSFVHDRASFTSAHPAPRSIIECITRGSDSSVNVFFTSVGNRSDLLFCGGVESIESLSGSSINEFTVNEQLVAFNCDVLEGEVSLESVLQHLEFFC